MPYDPNIHDRRSTRLHGYDYNQPGSYFVTVCTYEKQHVFGSIVNDEMYLNDAGQIVNNTWNTIPQRFPNIELDEYIIMPNHLHGIITNNGATSNAKYKSSNNPLSSHLSLLGQIIRTFKSASTSQIRKTVRPDFSWQHNYYEHIIRQEKDLDHIRQYIATNPAGWAQDTQYCLDKHTDERNTSMDGKRT
jgi:REP element-mobilizing transposase RayT